MRNDLKTLLVLGATSAVAHAYLRRAADDGVFSRYILTARNQEKLEIVRQDIAARSGVETVSVMSHLGDASQVQEAFDQVLQLSDQIDECLLAYGVLGGVPPAVLLETNFLSAAIWLEALATQFERQSYGRMAVIGSVAADRGRQSNYLYGASKAGLERLCEGLSHRFAQHQDIHFCCVKPGFIETPMTAHLDRSGLLWSRPVQIANIVRRALLKRRARVYAPWFWRYIMLIVRLLPRSIFHKTKL
ncbi:MAG: SDR family NAD(P)-dependent oxidoreductase [Pseudomonadota bacterium]